MAKRKKRKSARTQAYADMHMADWLDARKGNIRLAGPQPKVFRPQKRAKVVEDVLAFMRDWRVTPFENEAGVIHGIRSSLCLTGEKWPHAHVEAETVVRECLTRLGTERPDWSEGQREATESPDRCAWCAGPIPEELSVGGQVHRFCSSACARSAIQKRDFARRNDSDAAYRAAMDVVRRARCEPIECKAAGCSKRFRPREPEQTYCSTRCASDGQIGLRRKLPDRPCPTCGTDFRPLDGRRFCSVPCAIKGRSTFAVRKVCECCSANFTARSQNAGCCSKSCTRLMINLRAGNVRRVSPQVFDALWKGGKPSRPSVTAGLFEAA